MDTQRETEKNRDAHSERHREEQRESHGWTDKLTTRKQERYRVRERRQTARWSDCRANVFFSSILYKCGALGNVHGVGIWSLGSGSIKGSGAHQSISKSIG